jgi:hypothetical protein
MKRGVLDQNQIQAILQYMLECAEARKERIKQGKATKEDLIQVKHYIVRDGVRYECPPLDED